MSNQNIRRKLSLKIIAVSRVSSSAFRSHAADIRLLFLLPSCTVPPVPGWSDFNVNTPSQSNRMCVIVTRFSPESQAWPFLSRLLPEPPSSLSPRPPPPQPASSLPDAPLSLQGPADALAHSRSLSLAHSHFVRVCVWEKECECGGCRVLEPYDSLCKGAGQVCSCESDRSE